MVDDNRAVIHLLEEDVVPPVNIWLFSPEDLDQPLVLEVVPETKVGHKISPEGFLQSRAEAEQDEVYFSPDGTESLSVPATLFSEGYYLGHLAHEDPHEEEDRE
jgi:hypothetical protein